MQNKCKKPRLAVQLFTNISTNGPSLALYPASQRVTYLYYLGRFNFESSHFLRASRCLQEAYLQTPPVCLRHRRLILTYLIPANMLVGRFPSPALLQRQEAATLGPVFAPLARAVRTGDFILFQHTLAAHQAWLFARGLHIALVYRLRALVWRSFTRRVFLLTYVPPANADPFAPSRKAAVLDLNDVAAAAVYVQRRLEGYTLSTRPPGAPPPPPPPATRHAPPPHINSIFLKAVSNRAADAAAASSPAVLVPPAGGPRRLRPSEGVLWGNKTPTLHEVEGMVASLTAQGLLHGFVAHSGPRFAIMGAKQKGSAVLAGWPNVAQTIVERLRDDGEDPDEVPAWVKNP